jgi:predicted MFS family arabinose efflux permease
MPWPDRAYVVALLVVCAGLAFGAFYTPGMTLLTHAAEDRGLDYGYAFALVNLAWAPGQTVGAALGGTVAERTRDAVPYLALAALALLTFAGLWRSGSS